MTWLMMIDVMIDDNNQLINTACLTVKHPSLKTTKIINILFIIYYIHILRIIHTI